MYDTQLSLGTLLKAKFMSVLGDDVALKTPSFAFRYPLTSANTSIGLRSGL